MDGISRCVRSFARMCPQIAAKRAPYARIGDARSAWESGIISHFNAHAGAAGIAPGDNLTAFADKVSVVI